MHVTKILQPSDTEGTKLLVEFHTGFKGLEGNYTWVVVPAGSCYIGQKQLGENSFIVIKLNVWKI